MRLPALAIAALAAATVTSCASVEPFPDAGTAQVASSLAYVLEPKFEGQKLTLQVDLLFRGNASGKTKLILPDEWAGQKELYRGIRALELKGEAQLEETGDPHVRLISHAPNQPLHLSYEVRQDWEGLPADHERYYRPILNSEYFHFIGYGVFVHPDWDEKEPRKLTLKWNAWPEGWELLDSFGSRSRLQVIEQPIKWLRHSLYVGGKFRVQELKVEGKPVWLALKGKWKFADPELGTLLSRVMTSHRRFWNDNDFPYFLVSVMSVDRECCLTGGTGLFNSFATFVSDDLALDSGIKHLFSHELFHTWNGRRILRQQPEELVYWFTEGFTDYYARLLNLRSGLIDLPEYIRDYNTKIRQYYASPARNEANTRIQEDFWNDRQVERLPYQRGDLLAHNWNMEIRLRAPHVKKLFDSKDSSSLDDVMRDILKSARDKGTLVSAHSIDAAIKPYLPRGILEETTRYIDRGETIRPHERSLGPCAKAVTRKLHRFDLGFDAVASKRTKIVTGVRRGGPAWLGGLRDNQKLAGWSIENGNPEKPVELEVVDRKGFHKLRYLPAGKRFDVPQFMLDAEHFKRDPKACLAWFGS